MSDTQDLSHSGQSGTELGRLLAKAMELLAGQRQSLGAGDLLAVRNAMPQVARLLSEAARQQVTPVDEALARQVAQAYRTLLLSLAAGKEEIAAKIRQVNQSQRLVRVYAKSRV